MSEIQILGPVKPLKFCQKLATAARFFERSCVTRRNDAKMGRANSLHALWRNTASIIKDLIWILQSRYITLRIRTNNTYKLGMWKISQFLMLSLPAPLEVSHFRVRLRFQVIFQNASASRQIFPLPLGQNYSNCIHLILSYIVWSSMLRMKQKS